MPKKNKKIPVKTQQNTIRHNYKVTDEQFFSILRENAGAYALTARAIEKQYGIKYNRTSVKERAERHPDLLNDIREQNLDIAEAGLISLARSARSEMVRFVALKEILRTVGKKRGYTEKTEIEHSGNIALPQIIVRTELDKDNLEGLIRDLQKGKDE